MKLEANIERESVSLRARDGYADAGATRNGAIAALELEIEGKLRVYERDDGRANVLTLDFANREHGRRIALLLAEKLGMPMFTESEWLRITDACDLADASDLADRIRKAYAGSSDDAS